MTEMSGTLFVKSATICLVVDCPELWDGSHIAARVRSGGLLFSTRFRWHVVVGGRTGDCNRLIVGEDLSDVGNLTPSAI